MSRSASEASPLQGAAVYEVSTATGTVTVRGADYSESPISLQFFDAAVLRSVLGSTQRVEDGQAVKLQNGMRRLLLFDDDGLLFLEIKLLRCEVMGDR